MTTRLLKKLFCGSFLARNRAGYPFGTEKIQVQVKLEGRLFRYPAMTRLFQQPDRPSVKNSIDGIYKKESDSGMSRLYWRKPPRRSEPTLIKDDPLKAIGDKYERYIGEKHEEEGEVVIYNGFTMGLLDMGVDLISISPVCKSINLIQCKNWKNARIDLNELDNILSKLSFYDTRNLTSFFSFQTEIINRHATTPYDLKRLEELMLNIKNSPIPYEIRKTLYISSDKVISEEARICLENIEPNIYKYKDMQIVIKEDGAF